METERPATTMSYADMCKRGTGHANDLIMPATKPNKPNCTISEGTNYHAAKENFSAALVPNEREEEPALKDGSGAREDEPEGGASAAIKTKEERDLDDCSSMSSLVVGHLFDDTFTDEGVMDLNVPVCVAKRVFGHHFGKMNTLANDLARKCVNVSEVHLYVNKDMKTVTIKCSGSESCLNDIKRKLKEILEATMKSIDEGSHKLSYLNKDSGIHVNIGRGGIIKDIELSNDGTTLLVFKKKAVGDDLLFESLNAMQPITSVHKFEHVNIRDDDSSKWILWGKVKCEDNENVDTLIDSHKYGYSGYRFSNVQSNRQDVNGAIVEVKCEINAEQTLRVYLTKRKYPIYPDKISIGRDWCKCTLIDSQTIDVDLSSIHKSKRTGQNIITIKDAIKAHFAYMHQEVCGMELVSAETLLREYHLRGFRSFLHGVASQLGLERDKYSVWSLEQPGQTVNMITAHVTFKNREDAKSFYDKLQTDYKEYRSNNLTVSPLSFFTKNHITQHIFYVTQGGLDMLIDSTYEKRGEAIEIKIHMKHNGGVLVTITGTNQTDVTSVTNVLHKIVSPKQMICLKDKTIKLFYNVFGRRYIRQLENKLSVKIMCDDSCRTINIYGSPNMKILAYEKLVNFMNSCNGETKVISLTTFGKERPLVALLMKQYGHFLDRLCTDYGAKNVYLDLRNYDLYVCGSEKVVENIKRTISIYATRVNKMAAERRYANEEVCVVCFCPTVTEPYRLEYCGHTYCNTCIELQFGVATQMKDFPIQCAHDGCGEAIIWNDISNVLRHQPEEMQHLIQAAVSLFVAQNKDRYRFCISPDCLGLYTVCKGNYGNKFECPSCNVTLCCSCDAPFHEGISCGMYKASGNMDEKLVSWIKEDSANRDICPNCGEGVELIGGCNNVHCYTCKTCICWKCKMFFSDSIKCYEHLDATHGGYV